MNETLKIYGSDEDLSAFEKQLKDAGFDKLKDDPIQSNGYPNVPSIKYLIVSDIGNCIKTILSTRHQRIVTTEKNGEKIVIKGDLPVVEIERLLKCSRHFDIQNEVR
jgi:hypothetical protein